ncbi:hypothetical protein BV25DRAFT_1381693 [Artomyces pyxidatus]|uniref:Uncharacterized protein n=1 Tax=Artomyces pyxidatus TaxID=48021 RepID=A0ACB8TDG7_9AGAM|nr:hypothetical protein BV25DRAFT_1381693 [Artomyces pyxidatus]
MTMTATCSLSGRPTGSRLWRGATKQAGSDKLIRRSFGCPVRPPRGTHATGACPDMLSTPAEIFFRAANSVPDLHIFDVRFAQGYSLIFTIHGRAISARPDLPCFDFMRPERVCCSSSKPHLCSVGIALSLFVLNRFTFFWCVLRRPQTQSRAGMTLLFRYPSMEDRINRCCG